ncbi:MAG: hypothetical protein AAGD96_00160 [Chloroflexota bacterium]
MKINLQKWSRISIVLFTFLIGLSAYMLLQGEIRAQGNESRLGIKKEITASEGVLGGRIVYIVVISNTGTQGAKFSIVDTYPTGSVVISGSVKNTCDLDWSDSGIAIVTEPYDLQPGRSVTLTYGVQLSNLPPLPSQINQTTTFFDIVSLLEVHNLTTGTTISQSASTTVMEAPQKTFLPLLLTDVGIAKLGLQDKRSAVDSGFTYFDDFSSPCNPTNWRIVRQDTDVVSQTVEIIDPGYLSMRMESRYDYMIASDLTPLPNKPYTLTARMRLKDPDAGHTSGIVIGGDYDGTSECPAVDYSTCFNVYYRFIFIAGAQDDEVHVQIRRIEMHDLEGDNSGAGTTLGAFDLVLPNGSGEWYEWAIQVDENNDLTLYIDSEKIGIVNDSKFIDNAMFGFWSSTTDTTFSNTQVDWFKIVSD